MTTDQKVLQQLIEAEREGYTPITTELAAWVDCDRSTARRALYRLAGQGFIRLSGLGRWPKPILAKVLAQGRLQTGIVSSAVQVTTPGAKHE